MVLRRCFGLLQVSSIPNVVLFSNGKEFSRTIGAVSKENISAAIEKLINSHKSQ